MSIPRLNDLKKIDDLLIETQKLEAIVESLTLELHHKQNVYDLELDTEKSRLENEYKNRINLDTVQKSIAQIKEKEAEISQKYTEEIHKKVHTFLSSHHYKDLIKKAYNDLSQSQKVTVEVSENLEDMVKDITKEATVDKNTKGRLRLVTSSVQYIFDPELIQAKLATRLRNKLFTSL